VRHSWKLLALGALALGAARPGAAQQPGDVHEQVTVSQVEVTLHVTDKQGRVVPDLKKEDFQLFVDGQPVAIESVEWVGSISDAAPSRSTTIERVDKTAKPDTAAEAVPAEAPAAPGRLFVMVFQSHIEGQKDEGLMRMKRQALKFLDTLGPDDQVALLVFGSRLWLSQDFTSDRAVLRKAIHSAPRKEETERPESPDAISIGAHLSHEDERLATSMEKGLTAIGRALRPLPGSKAILFFGYAVGRWNALSETASNAGMGHFVSTRELEAAQTALAAAQSPVFSLDISSGAHTLGAGLKQLSFETGGFYMRTESFPDWAMGVVREAVKGHYTVTFAKPQLKPGPHRIQIDKMRGAAPWNLLYRQEYDDSVPVATAGSS
jgi:VWFA-related protein